MDGLLLVALLPVLFGLLAVAALAWAESTPFCRPTGTITPVTPTGGSAFSDKEQP